MAPHAIILDGIHNYLMSDCHTECMVKADQKSSCVAAASVVAKVSRDTYMERLAALYPEYGFDDHKGYLTPSHRAAIVQFGPSPIHRLRWKTFEGEHGNH